MGRLFTATGLFATLLMLGGCCFSSDFWDRSCAVGGEYGRDAPSCAPRCAPRQKQPNACAPRCAPRQQQPNACAPQQAPRTQTYQAQPDPLQPPQQQAPQSADPYSPFAARPPRAAPPSRSSGPTREDMDVLSEVNRIRASRGLRQLRHNPRLFVAARDHSNEQMRHGYMGHGSPDKSRDQLSERIALAQYDGRAFAEVVAWGYRDCRSVVEGWMNSRPHRAILLDNDFTEAAFSRAGLYWTGNFGLPGGRRAGRARRPAASQPRAQQQPTPRYAPRTQPVPRRAPARAAPTPAPRQAPSTPNFVQAQPRQNNGFG